MNYCTKCGKPIADGESKICDDCKNNLLMDLETEEQEGFENKYSIKDENEEKEEFKVKSEKKDNKKNSLKKSKKAKKNRILVYILILVILAVIVVLGIKKFSGNKIGITIGNNNNNYGQANIQGNWIYYMTLSEDSMEVAINKIKTNGKNKTLLVQKDWEIYSINVYGNYIYFIAFEPTTDQDGSTTVYQNNKIYKMSLDGKEIRVINDNEFCDDCKAIYVVNDRIYFIGENYGIYSMDLEGGDRKRINAIDNEEYPYVKVNTGYIGITDKYIIFNDYPENPQSETDFITYIMDIDGRNLRTINNQRLYNVNVEGNYIYYVNGENNEIHRIKPDGTGDKKIYSSVAYNMNVSNGYIYYLNYKSENADSIDEPVCLHRVSVNGKKHSVIKEFENYSSLIDIVGDWVYYTDHTDTAYYMNLVRSDGKKEINLYTFELQQD